jgi:hypothetical protein
MEYQERKAWLASLKPGDVVAVQRTAYGESSYVYSRAVIEYITLKRTRFDVMHDPTKYNSHGEYHPGGYSSGTSIVPWTDEVRDTIVFRNAKRRCKDARWDDLPKEIVLQVSGILRNFYALDKAWKAIDKEPENG